MFSPNSRSLQSKPAQLYGGMEPFPSAPRVAAYAASSPFGRLNTLYTRPFPHQVGGPSSVLDIQGLKLRAATRQAPGQPNLQGDYIAPQLRTHETDFFAPLSMYEGTPTTPSPLYPPPPSTSTQKTYSDGRIHGFNNENLRLPPVGPPVGSSANPTARGGFAPSRSGLETWDCTQSPLIPPGLSAADTQKPLHDTLALLRVADSPFEARQQPRHRLQSPTATQVSRIFQPMKALNPFKERRRPDPGSHVPATMFSANYRGEKSLRNCSAAIPDSENCSLWITNLPADLTYNQLLSSIHNTGRVYATVISPPSTYKAHIKSACKLVFFTRRAAQSLYLHAQVNGFFVGGLRSHVSWNRIKSAEHKEFGKRSRVLIITGHVSFVNEETLTRWFSDRFAFQIDTAREICREGDGVILEYRFGSYRCQAESGRMALSREKPPGLSKVEWGEDPCACDPPVSSSLARPAK